MGSANSSDADSDEVEERPWRQLLHHQGRDPAGPQLTLRAVLAGLFVGTILCFTNMYFGLQTGWVTMGSIQCALVGFGIFRACGSSAPRFGPLENVVLQTVGVATATLPLAGGFIGIIPALRLLDPPVELSFAEQLGWAAALTYFGIFFAVPLRRQTILVEKLAFPSGTATAKLIDLLHGGASSSVRPPSAFDAGRTATRWSTGGGPWRALGVSFAASFGIAAAATLALPSNDPTLHVASWIGFPAATKWRWTLRPSLALVGQGMIMGQRSALSLLLGAVLAWSLLGPAARARGWARGPISDFEHGAQGWVLWIAIALMLSEALTSLALLVLHQLSRSAWCGSKQASHGGAHRREVAACDDVSITSSPISSSPISSSAINERRPAEHDATMHLHASGLADPLEVAPAWQLVPTSWWLTGLIAALGAAIAILSPMLGMPATHVLVAGALSCVVAVLAVRALGETDLNPVSGVGKLSQLVFAIVAPGHVVANIVAGALAEAGAMQAGDLLQDLKAGHLLGASPRAQFYGQLIGATWSVFVTVGAFQLYDRAYGVPSPQFAAPVANVWKDMAMLMKDGLGALPPNSLSYAKYFAAGGVALPLLEHACALAPSAGRLQLARQLLPSGMSVGIGMYLTPDFTLPRVLGSVAELAWRRYDAGSHRRQMLVVASGFVLGEGIWSIVALGLQVLRRGV